MLFKASAFYIRLKHDLEKSEKFKVLSNRENEVLSLKSQGYSIKKVADIMGTCDATVVFHLKNIRTKLNVKTTEQVLYLYGNQNETSSF
jgi:DNA-binding NarL/FixJ family response regulator